MAVTPSRAHQRMVFSLLANDPNLSPMLENVGKRIGAVAARIASGDAAGAAEQFVETVALGPGTWARLPPDLQQTFIDNAPTFLDELRDRARYWGWTIGVGFGEPFLCRELVGLRTLRDLL